MSHFTRLQYARSGAEAKDSSEREATEPVRGKYPNYETSARMFVMELVMQQRITPSMIESTRV